MFTKKVLTDLEVLKRIESYKPLKAVKLEIWEVSRFEACLTVTLLKDGLDKPLTMTNSFSFTASSANEELGEIPQLKAEGRRLKALIAKHFKDLKVTSNLRY